MKKYLFTSAAALAICGLFTSCTHDLGYDESSAQNSVVKKYEQAFITAFGQPDPNQEWGFGVSTVATRALTRATNQPQKPTFHDGTNNLPTFSKPDNPTFYNTVTEAKQAGVNVVAAEGKTVDPQSNTTYSIGKGTSFNNLQNCSGITLYVTENMTFSPSFSANGNTIVVTKDIKFTLGGAINEKVNIYLAPGAELITSSDLTLNNNGSSTPYKLYLSSGSTITGGAIYVDNGYQVLNDGGTISSSSIRVQKSTLWNEGTITLTGDLTTYNGEAKIFNAAGKTFTVGGKLDLTNNNDILYNNGNMPITGNITLKDGTTEIINNGTLSSEGDLDMKAGGAFHNVGNATISGQTYIYNTNSFWMNDGHYTTGSFSDQNCEKVFNNCYMTVDGEFYLGSTAGSNGHSIFNLEGGGEREDESGAYVKCGSFTYGGNTDIFMGNKSFIEVENDFKSTNNNDTYGIHGPASGSYAVIKADNFTKEGNPYISMTYYGNLYIDTETHYPKGTDNANPYYVYDSSVKFSFKDEDFSVKIPKTNCNPGYGKDPDPSYDGILRVVCEDLSVTQASDWDFNDVVFDVQLYDDNNQVKITLLAAGGTLPLCVGDDDSDNRTHEVHELFAKANPGKNITTSTMINTGHTGAKYTITGCKEASFYLTIKDEWKEGHDSGEALLKSVAKNIPIDVYKMVDGEKRWVPIEWKKGKPTAKMAFGTNYNWCDERDDIRTTFRAKIGNSDYTVSTFEMFVQGILGVDWYMRKTVTDEEYDRFNPQH